MCFHDKPTRNDELGAWEKWHKKEAPPPIQDGDELLFDECGRCSPQVNGSGGIDYHSHHFRLVRHGSFYFLLVRHGGGDERVELGSKSGRTAEILAFLDSDARYLTLHTLYHVHQTAKRAAEKAERTYWMKAAAEKRIRTQKERGRDFYKVWVDDAPPEKR